MCRIGEIGSHPGDRDRSAIVAVLTYDYRTKGTFIELAEAAGRAHSMTAVTVDIWSDIHCPWALVAVHRLRAARARHGLDVVFAPRAWPLEWVNDHGTPRSIVTTETAALAGHEPELFNAYRNDSWPSTFLPAFELVAAARRRHGARAAEDVDYALRLAFFRDSVDVSVRAGLQ